MDDKKLCMGCMKMLPPGKTKCDCGFDEERYERQQYWLTPGTVLNDSIIVGRVIGEGGFGITYIGYNRDLEIRVAVKEFYIKNLVSRNTDLSQEIYSGTKAIEEKFEYNKEKFINEARSLAKFSDEKGVVSIYNYFKENNTAYIVMEYIDGQTLQSYIKNNGVMTAEEVAKIFNPILDVLDRLHKNKIIHRDISPDNIMITKDGNLKLLDFGAAREREMDSSKSITVIAKTGYTPFEQYGNHGNQGPWTDIYALCATMYTCITGEVPESSIDRMTKDDEIEYGDIVCDEQMKKIIKKGMSSYVEDRYANIGELKEDLNRLYLQSNHIIDNPKSDKKSLIKNKKIVAGILIFIILLCIAIPYARYKSTAEKKRAESETKSEEVSGSVEESEEKNKSEAVEEPELESEIADYEVSYIGFAEDKSKAEIDKAIEIVEERLDFYFGKGNYEFEKAEDHCKLTVPVEALMGEDAEELFDKTMFLPSDLNFSYGYSYHCDLGKEDIVSAEALNGVIEDIDLSDEKNYNGEDYNYIKLTLSDSAIRKIDDVLSNQIDSESDSKIRVALAGLYYNGYVYYDKFSKSLYFTDLKQNIKVMELIAHNIMQNAFDKCFKPYTLKAAYWEREKVLIDDQYVKMGEHQVDPEYFADNGINAVDVLFNKSSDSFGDWIDKRNEIQKILDTAGITYSLGKLNSNEFSTVVRLPAEGTGCVYYKFIDISRFDFYTYDKCYYDQLDLDNVDKFIASIEYDDNSIRFNLSDGSKDDYYAKYYDSLFKKPKINDNKIAWKIYTPDENDYAYFYGVLDEENKCIVFDKTTLSKDGKINSEMKKLFDLVKAVNENNANNVFNSYISYYSYAVVADSYDDIEQLDNLLLHNRFFDTSSERIKDTLTYSIGAEPDIEMRSTGLEIKYKQNISENMAENMARIVTGVFESGILDGEGLFQIPKSITVRFSNSDNAEMAQISIDLSKEKNGKYSVSIYSFKKIPEDKQEMYDREIKELLALIKNEKHVYVVE